mgnify:CR=1 FL=1
MNIKTKLTLNIGVLVAMIVLLVSLSVVNLQILTATEPTSPAAVPVCNGHWYGSPSSEVSALSAAFGC